MNEVTRTDWSAIPDGYMSPSKAWAWLACPRCFYYERILHVPKPISADLLVGRFTHSAVASMRQHLMADEAEDLTRDLEAGDEAFTNILNRQVDVEETGEETPVEVELGKKYSDLGQAKDVAVNLTRYVLPVIARYDKLAGVVAAEARVRHLGPSFHGYPELFVKMSPDEQLDAQEEGEEQFVGGIEPIFPFPFKAFLDVLYANGWLKDLKTSSRQGSPDALASLQLLTYALPWWKAGQQLKLAWDVAVKTKSPDFATYYVNETGEVTDEQYEYARQKTLWVADQICEGNFPVNEASLWHRYMHELPSGTRAAMEDWHLPATA